MNQNDELKNKAESKLADDEVSKAVGGSDLRGMPPRKTEPITCPYCTRRFPYDQYKAHFVACRTRERNRQENNDGPDLTVPGTMDPV